MTNWGARKVGPVKFPDGDDLMVAAVKATLLALGIGLAIGSGIVWLVMR